MDSRPTVLHTLAPKVSCQTRKIDLSCYKNKTIYNNQHNVSNFKFKIIYLLNTKHNLPKFQHFLDVVSSTLTFLSAITLIGPTIIIQKHTWVVGKTINKFIRTHWRESKEWFHLTTQTLPYRHLPAAPKQKLYMINNFHIRSCSTVFALEMFETAGRPKLTSNSGDASRRPLLFLFRRPSLTKPTWLNHLSGCGAAASVFD